MESLEAKVDISPMTHFALNHESSHGLLSKDEVIANEMSDVVDEQVMEDRTVLPAFNCDRCKKEFDQIWRLKRHKDMAVCMIDSAGILSAQELLSMTCATCGHHSARLTDLRNHIRNLACNLPLRNCDIYDCMWKKVFSQLTIERAQTESSLHN